jgi:hypothetical protein
MKECEPRHIPTSDFENIQKSGYCLLIHARTQTQTQTVEINNTWTPLINRTAESSFISKNKETKANERKEIGNVEELGTSFFNSFEFHSKILLLRLLDLCMIRA